MGAITAFVLLVSLADFRFRDPDSRLYSNLAQAIARKPISEWITPKWEGFWARDDLFREHPPLLLWVTAAFIRLGTPPEQAAGVANFIYYLFTIYFVFRIGRLLAGSTLGWAMGCAVLLTPVTLQYLIRGNLEPPLTMAVIGGMYAFLIADRSPVARAGFALALVSAVFFKGMQGAILAIVAGLYWLFWSRDRRRFLVLFSGITAAVLACALHEWLYRATSGEGFWLVYVKIQAGIALKSHSPWDKLYNLAWYLARTLYFALPWSIILIAGMLHPQTPPIRDPRWRWLLVSALVLVLIMSYFERRADRYVFPSFTLLAMAGGWVLWARDQRLREFFERKAERMPYLFAGALLAVSAGKILATHLFYRTIQIWRE